MLSQNKNGLVVAEVVRSYRRQDMTLEIHSDQQARMNMLSSSTRKGLQKTVDCKRLSDNAAVPTRSHESDAGWDLYSSDDLDIMPNHRRVVSTGICLSIPDGYVGLIWPRSGLAVKKGLDVFAGVIDAGYRGEIKVCLYNSSETTVKISTGDRIAQMIFHELPKIEIKEVGSLDNSDRGSDGFGSSGA